jgi:hypothetical protein
MRKKEPPGLVAPEVKMAENDTWPVGFILSKPAFYCAGFSKDRLFRSN